MDKAGVRAFHEELCAAFPQARVEILDLIEGGDKLGARLLLHLVHEGEFIGVGATGREAKFPITTLLTVRDGRCVERWSTADMYGLLVQLGALPAPTG